VRQLERPSRAVTAADFEQLAGAVPNVARAKCIPRLNLEDPEAASRATPAPGHVSIVILPQSGSEAAPELVHRVRQALESARLLTTRLHVVLPRFLKMSVHVTIGAGRGAHPETLREEASRRIQLLFHPLNGGLDGKGWPLGRKVHVSDIYAVLADLPGIDFVAPVRTPNGALMEELALASPDASRLKRNPRGELEAIELRRDEFVEIEIGRGDIVLASRP
jgi:predicted phage baseplate assembly protein